MHRQKKKQKKRKENRKKYNRIKRKRKKKEKFLPRLATKKRNKKKAKISSPTSDFTQSPRGPGASPFLIDVGFNITSGATVSLF